MEARRKLKNLYHGYIDIQLKQIYSLIHESTLHINVILSGAPNAHMLQLGVYIYCIYITMKYNYAIIGQYNRLVPLHPI